MKPSPHDEFKNHAYRSGTLSRKMKWDKKTRLGMASYMYGVMIEHGYTEAEAKWVYQAYMNNDEMYLNTETGGVVGDKT